MEHTLFPREVTDDLPRVTLTGDEEARVEQHAGLVSYQPDKIVFRLHNGGLILEGESLYFSAYSAMEAIVRGHIAGIRLETDAHGGTKP